jgi:hypothetical protein
MKSGYTHSNYYRVSSYIQIAPIAENTKRGNKIQLCQQKGVVITIQLLFLTFLNVTHFCRIDTSEKGACGHDAFSEEATDRRSTVLQQTRAFHDRNAVLKHFSAETP